MSGRPYLIMALCAALMTVMACDKKADPTPTDDATATPPAASANGEVAQDGEGAPKGDGSADGMMAKPTDGASGVKGDEPPASTETPEPDSETTAATPPTAEDLKRYTQDLGTGQLRAKIATTMGELNCELYEDKAPMTVANFVGLARGLKAWSTPIIDMSNPIQPVKPGDVNVGKALYKDVECHRVIPDFMIQCGDPSGTGMGGPGYKIRDEFGPGLKHTRGGLLSMANAGPNTGGSQFFVTEVATPWLDNKHAIFGHCDELDLIKKIARVDKGAQDRPVVSVKITGVEVYRGEKK